MTAAVRDGFHSTNVGADVPNAPAQPAMRLIGVQPRVPEQCNRDLRYSDRKGKTMHSDAEISGVSFGNTGNQVGGPGERQRSRKAADDGDDLPCESERRQSVVNRSFVETAP